MEIMNMKIIIWMILSLLIAISVNAQSEIPQKITTNLVLKQQAKPYTSTGFTVEKGATLTIMPGAKITMALPKEVKSFQVEYAHPNININGTLIIGAKGSGKSAPVVFDGSAPRLFFNDAILDINNWDITAAKYQFSGNNNGSFNNVNFFIKQSSVLSVAPSVFTITVPKTGNLSFNDCLIENQGVDIITTDFPNDLDRLTIIKCAITSKIKNGKLSQHFMPITMFAYGTKCDCHIGVTFKAFDWPLKKPLSTEWFISNESTRKTTSESAKSLKGFSLKLATKPFTDHKQEAEPPPKDEKK